MAAWDETVGITYVVNAVDDFIPSRASFVVTCSHPDITDAEIAVGRLKSGRIRVLVAVPDEAQLGEFQLDVAVADWMRAAGGLGPRLPWTTILADEVAPPGGSIASEPTSGCIV